MIDAGYCRVLARYNAWQNRQLTEAFETLPVPELTRDRGAFFGSLLKTANHLLWGDQIWMSRFSDVPKPDAGIPESPDLFATLDRWRPERQRIDSIICRWADGLPDGPLKGDLEWFSGALDRTVRKPLALCVTHMFNHQTHHRGQIHSMLTAAIGSAPVSDLFAMPETD